MFISNAYAQAAGGSTEQQKAWQIAPHESRAASRNQHEGAQSVAGVGLVLNVVLQGQGNLVEERGRRFIEHGLPFFELGIVA